MRKNKRNKKSQPRKTRATKNAMEIETGNNIYDIEELIKLGF